MIGFVGVFGVAMAAMPQPIPYGLEAFFQNSSGRYATLASQPTLGRVRGGSRVIVAGSELVGTATSECMWGAYESVLFLGPPPKSCRRGKRHDGFVQNGRSYISVQDGIGATVDVIYPALVPDPDTAVGPFEHCTRTATLGLYACHLQPYTAVEVFGNTSSVWVHEKDLLAQASLFQGLGLVEAVLFALMASRGKAPHLRGMNSVMALAADLSSGGAITQTLLFATGRSVVGLDVEVGMTSAYFAEAAMTAWCMALATCAYLHAASYEVHYVMPSWRLDEYSLPFQPILRELCEIPLLASLVIIWPESAGPNFLTQLQFMCGLAISFIAGRGAGLLLHFQQEPYAILGASFLLLGGISVPTILCLGTVAASGAITRGGPAIAFTAALQVHAAAGGYYFGTRSRIRQLTASDETAEIQAAL